jgi:hypothetical protein
MFVKKLLRKLSELTRKAGVARIILEYIRRKSLTSAVHQVLLCSSNQDEMHGPCSEVDKSIQNFGWKPVWKIPPVRPRCRWKNHINMNLKAESEGVEWINIAQGSDKLQTFVNTRLINSWRLPRITVLSSVCCVHRTQDSITIYSGAYEYVLLDLHTQTQIPLLCFLLCISRDKLYPRAKLAWGNFQRSAFQFPLPRSPVYRTKGQNYKNIS